MKYKPFEYKESGTVTRCIYGDPSNPTAREYPIVIESEHHGAWALSPDKARALLRGLDRALAEYDERRGA